MWAWVAEHQAGFIACSDTAQSDPIANNLRIYIALNRLSATSTIMKTICPSSTAVRPAVVARPQRARAAAPRLPVNKVRDVSCAFFKFGGGKAEPKDRRDVDFARPEQRGDYEAEDVEMYFNYMGCLANEGSYDRMEALQNAGIAPVDILLLLASQEGDTPKIVELLAAGADVTVKNVEGKTPLQLATKDEVIALLKEHEQKKAATV